MQRNISNTEVTTYLTCRRMYFYQFILELQPKKLGKPLLRGIIFHEVMEIYWKARLNGMNHLQSMAEAQKKFADITVESPVDVLMEVQVIWTRYMEAHNGWPNWRPLGAEETIKIPISDTLTFTFKYDFYYQDLETGAYYVLDYKLTYDFWTEWEHKLNAQMPKYIAGMQSAGFRVDGGMLEEVRTREVKTTDKWRSTPYHPSAYKIRGFITQHIDASMEIEAFRALPTAEQKKDALPVLNKFGACKFCNFRDLCEAEVAGETDISGMIAVGYEQSTYGYNQKDLL